MPPPTERQASVAPRDVSSDSGADRWSWSDYRGDLALAVVPLVVAIALAGVSAIALIELTMERGLLGGGGGILAPVATSDRVGVIAHFVLLPLLIGLVGALMAIVIVARRRLAEVGDLARTVGALAPGTAPALDVTRPDDIGDVNRAFTDLHDEVERSRRAERLFLLRVSHELRTPVAAIRGQAEALADGLFEDLEDREDSYGAIIAEADRLERLIGDLMDIARLRAQAFRLDRDEIDPAALLNTAVRAVSVSAKRAGVEVRSRHDGLAPIIGDGDRLLQVVGNLLRNAVRWAPRGGSVQVFGAFDGDWFVVTVDDSGTGIAPERRERIFEVFYSESGAGSGLGLAIVRDLLRAMGGDVTIDDAPTGGARFIVRVPRIPGPVRSGTD